MFRGRREGCSGDRGCVRERSVQRRCRAAADGGGALEACAGRSASWGRGCGAEGLLAGRGRGDAFGCTQLASSGWAGATGGGDVRAVIACAAGAKR